MESSAVATNGLRRRHWMLNRRTLCITEEFEAVWKLHGQGAYSSALAVLDDVVCATPEMRLRKLNASALILLALGDYEQSLDTLEQAEEALQSLAGASARDRAIVLCTRVTVLKSLDAYAEALVAAEQAVRLVPSWAMLHLVVIGLHAADENLDAAATAFERMDTQCPGWRSDVEIHRYLSTDIEYAALWLDTRFQAWLNHIGRHESARWEQ